MRTIVFLGVYLLCKYIDGWDNKDNLLVFVVMCIYFMYSDIKNIIKTIK